MTLRQFINVLKNSNNIDIPNLKKKYSLEDIEKNIIEIVKSDKELKEAKAQNQFRENLLQIISYLFTVEQNNLQKRSEKASLKIQTFDDEFINRINTLL